MTFQRKRVLVVAKTYPNLSSKYDRTVCTAGIDIDANSWIRIFPIRFFDLPIEKRPKKYDIIEVDVEPTTDKFRRKESHKAHDDSIQKVSHIGTENNWENRKRVMFPLLRRSVEELDGLYKDDNTSLGMIKPGRITGFNVTPIAECRDWERDLILGIQKTLFGEYKTPLDKMPYKFSYIFECQDPECKGHDLMIEDWEICQLFRSVREESNDENAIVKVREKYMQDFTTNKDLYLILGTESRWNKWLIIGVFYPKKT